MHNVCYLRYIYVLITSGRAMGGTVDFKTALQTRLSVMKPRRQDVERFLIEHPHKITPGRRFESV